MHVKTLWKVFRILDIKVNAHFWSHKGIADSTDLRFARASRSSDHSVNILSWRFSHDVTKIQTKKLSLLLSFYFHVILEHLKTFVQTNFRLKRVLCFALQDAWISRLLRDAAFGWRPGKLLGGLRTLRFFFMSSSREEFTQK